MKQIERDVWNFCWLTPSNEKASPWKSLPEIECCKSFKDYFSKDNCSSCAKKEHKITKENNQHLTSEDFGLWLGGLDIFDQKKIINNFAYFIRYQSKCLLKKPMETDITNNQNIMDHCELLKTFIDNYQMLLVILYYVYWVKYPNFNSN